MTSKSCLVNIYQGKDFPKVESCKEKNIVLLTTEAKESNILQKVSMLLVKNRYCIENVSDDLLFPLLFSAFLFLYSLKYRSFTVAIFCLKYNIKNFTK